MNKRNIRNVGIPMVLAFALTGVVLLLGKTASAAKTPSYINSGTQYRWFTETIATTRAGDSSLAIDHNNRLHLSYYESVDGLYGKLKYALRDGSIWSIQTVDNEGGAFSSLVLDSEGNPHISYYAIGPDGKLKYALRVGNNWVSETVATGITTGGSGFGTSLALDNENNPHIAYSEYVCPTGPCHDRLQYIFWTGTGWTAMTVDSDQGRSPSLIVTDSNHAYISYYDRSNGLLKYAHRAGSSWATEIVTSTSNDSYDTHLALDSTGNPHIAYHDNPHNELRYASWTGSGWDIETVDNIGDTGWWNIYLSLALDSNDNPHLSCYSDRGLMYAHWTGSEWITETASTEPASETSLVIDDQNRPYIVYYAGLANKLMLAWRMDIQGQIYLPLVLKQ